MRNLHQEITDRIVTRLKAGVVPWRQPWSGKGYGVMPRNAVNTARLFGRECSFALVARQESVFAAPLWVTFKQALELGGNVRKGEKGETVIYVAEIIKEDKDGERRAIPFLKAYTVFNVAQCDNLPARITAPAQPRTSSIQTRAMKSPKNSSPRPAPIVAMAKLAPIIGRSAIL